jgi:hypothetical protein
MPVYFYIAQVSPEKASEICKKYGFFQASDTAKLADVLEMIVAQGGEESFKEVMELHPDKEAILELFEKKSLEQPNKVGDCGCKNSSFKNRRRLANAGGRRLTNANGNIATQTNTYILIGALVVSIAIISSIKKG